MGEPEKETREEPEPEPEPEREPAKDGRSADEERPDSERTKMPPREKRRGTGLEDFWAARGLGAGRRGASRSAGRRPAVVRWTEGG